MIFVGLHHSVVVRDLFFRCDVVLLSILKSMELVLALAQRLEALRLALLILYAALPEMRLGLRLL